MFSYNLATAIGKVRLLIPDNKTSGHVYADSEIQGFLDLEGSNVWRAAALALEVLAADNAQVLKYTKIQGVEVDGTKVSQALLSRAQLLRSRAQEGDPSAASTDTGFLIAQPANTPQQVDQILWNEALDA